VTTQKANVSHLPLWPGKRHPLTGEPLRAIAMHPRTGQPVWPCMGGAPDDPPGNDDWTKVFEGKTPAEVQAALTAAEAKAAERDQWTNVFTGRKPEDVKADMRKHEQRAAQNKAKADKLDELAGTLGITPPPDPDDPNDKDKNRLVDPDAVTAAVEAEKARTRATLIENAVLRHAPTGVSGVALVDSRAFMDTAAKLDPAAEDFTTKLGEAIKTATEGPDGARFKIGRDRPGLDPRRGLESEGEQGSVEAGRTAYAERKKARRSYANA
jgi:hypothetical protein